jgi:hypothetical protein
MENKPSLDDRLARYERSRSILPPREWHNNIRVSLRGRWVYVENAKVGCTTIKKTLYVLELSDSPLLKAPHFASIKAAQLHDAIHGPTLSLVQLPESDAIEAITGPSYFRFSFVRNPFTRTLSAYLDKLTRPTPQRTRFAKAAKLDPERPIAFHDFLEHMEQKPRLLALDKHWRPQVLNLAGLPLDWTGRFERFQEELSAVLATLTKRMPEVYRGAEASVQSLIPHESRAGERLSEYYGAKEVAIVRELYGQDFREYGYSDSLHDAAAPA